MESQYRLLNYVHLKNDMHALVLYQSPFYLFFLTQFTLL